ncbi:MAG: EI24 domain-containing protein [Myxococcales bacterium]|jgi:CysZ protein
MNIPDLHRAGPLDFFRGFAIPFRGMRLIFGTSKLMLLTLSVAAVTFFSLIGVLIALWYLAPDLVAAFWKEPEAWYALIAHKLLVALVYGLLFIIGANVMPPLLVAPLMDSISVQAEKALGFPVNDDGGFGRLVKETVRAVANGLVRLLVLLVGQAALLPLLLIPVAGGPLWTGLSWCWTAVWVAVSYLDVPMARYLYNFDHEVHVLKKRLPLCLGFGAAIALMLWIPLLNSFFVPVAVVSATVLFRALVAASTLPQPAAPSEPPPIEASSARG